MASIERGATNEQFLTWLPSADVASGDQRLRDAVAGAELVVCAVPAQHLRSLIESIDFAAPLVLNVAKDSKRARACG